MFVTTARGRETFVHRNVTSGHDIKGVPRDVYTHVSDCLTCTWDINASAQLSLTSGVVTNGDKGLGECDQKSPDYWPRVVRLSLNQLHEDNTCTFAYTAWVAWLLTGSLYRACTKHQPERAQETGYRWK